MKNTQHRTPLSNNSLIHRHHFHLESSDSETDNYNFSKLNVKQQWWKHASESVTPHPLACVPLQPLAKPPFFPSFHPATNTVTTQLTYKKDIHPTLSGKHVLFLFFPTSQRPRIQGQVTSRDLMSAAAPS